MRLSKNIQFAKLLINQGSDLILLRLRLLALDVHAQAANILKIIGVIVFAAVIALFGLISVLFCLNNILEQQAKVWVFGIIALVCILIVIGLLIWACASWRAKGKQVMTTLRDMQQDIAYLKGQMGSASSNDEKEG